jgi:hypothetical protein
MLGRSKRSTLAASAALAASALALLTGCGEDGERAANMRGTTTREPPSVSRSAPEPHRKEPAEVVVPSRCPAGLAGCRSTEGRIVYVERVDPDGDGDAHFVVVDSQGITLPGLTAIDVRKGLRPHPLPGPGGLISAAGPVETGSYGQSQIHALVVHVGK